MANNSLVGEFNVQPEALLGKANKLNAQMLAISDDMRFIEEDFKKIMGSDKIWRGKLSNKYVQILRTFFLNGTTGEGMNLNSHSDYVKTYAKKVYELLDGASQGYITTDHSIEKTINDTDKAPAATKPASPKRDSEPTTKAPQTTQPSKPTTKPSTTTKKYDLPEGETYAKQVQSINSLSKEKNPDGSYYYKASAIAYGGKDSTGKVWDTKTEEGTGLRYIEEGGEKYYCAAMGTMYGNAGDKVKITTDTGNTWNVIITDSKSVKDAETVKIDGKTYSQYHYWDGNVKDLCELNCKYSEIPSNVKEMGSWHVLKQFSGNVVSIEPIS